MKSRKSISNNIRRMDRIVLTVVVLACVSAMTTAAPAWEDCECGILV